MANKPIQTDVTIVGAGLVGLTAAIALSKLNYQVTLVDANKLTKKMQKAWDARIYALTEVSQQWLVDIGLWAYVNHERINQIDAMHLWQDDNKETPDLVLDAESANLPQMGCIIESQNLMVAAWKALKETDVTMITEKTSEVLDNSDLNRNVLTLANGQVIESKLLLGADGANSWVRQQLNIGVQAKSFNQTAIVANFKTNVPHQNIAKQWFGSHETLALLPMPNNHVSLVWSLPSGEAKQQLNSEASIESQIAARTKLPENSLSIINDCKTFPLHQQTANRLIGTRCALLGDAAHQIHPMAGQGVNLGFKGVMELESVIANLTALHDVGDNSVLRAYERKVKQGVFELTGLTSGIDSLFAIDHPLVEKTLLHGMQWLNRSALLKKTLVKRATL